MAVTLKRKGTREAPGPFVAEIFDDGRKLIEGVTPVEALRRNAEVVPILTCGGIWIVDGKFGVTWTLKQAVIKVPGDGAGSAGAFLGVDEEGDGTLVTAADEDLMAAVLPSKSTNKFAAAAPADEDEDEDEEQEEEEEDHVEEAPKVPVGKIAKAAPAVAPALAKAPAKVGKVTKVAK